MKKVMVFHPGQQHSYRLATALNKVGLLGCYCTTVYNRPASLTRKMLLFLKGDSKIRAEARHCNEIRDDQVVQYGEFFGLLTILFAKLGWRKAGKVWNQFVNDYCGKKAAKHAIKYEYDCVISYNNNSKAIFEYLSKHAPNIIRVMDASAANVLYMKEIYEKDMELAPEFKNLLLQERGILWNSNYQKRISAENKLAQYLLVGSEFVKKSYVEKGYLEKNIYVCRYGVDISIFCQKEKSNYSGERPLECVFVGGTKELKGVSYMLEAFKMIPNHKARLTIIGKNTLNKEMQARYEDNVTFTGSILHNQVAKILREMDIMIFPSLGEGFSLALVEGLATGLPVIASENSGSSELIKDGWNGFVIPIQNKNEIRDKVLYFVNNSEKVADMSINAHLSVLSLTWEDYYHNVIHAIKEIVYGA